MQFLRSSRRIARLVKPIAVTDANLRFVSSASQISGSFQWRNHASASSSLLQGMESFTQLHSHSSSVGLLIPRSSFSSEAEKLAGNPTVNVKELHAKILSSVNVKRSMPPNAWLWSLIESCQNQDDIHLLFEVLQNLRRFRLSNLRIHDNFNSNLCQQVAKACVRVGAIESGKKALWKHNVHGLTPSVASAHHLLAYALEHKNPELMEEVMKLLKTNDLPLQPGSAMIQIRDTESLWKVDKLRSETYSQHTLSTAFSCAKGFLVEGKPEEAAAVIQVICQMYPDEKNSAVSTEFKKLVNEWPIDVIRRQTEEDKKGLAASLKSAIPSMVNALLSSGLTVNVDLDELYKNEALLS
ncbi:unnamed protein product [Thlaspi arvense]|uniref:Adenylyl cyclase n=1 Tax=Thlaspi arvense TaxID=13288 RepID=A0AAU9T5M1_THLAR|nr:unnamed protein product [Thlaspi arvense]